MAEPQAGDVAEPQGGDDLVSAFARWAALERVGEAARRRARERWLRDQASSTATWIGVLVDLAEQSARVVISVGGGRRSGRIVGVGSDFCVIEQDSGRAAIVAIAAIASLVPGPGPGAARAGAPPPTRSPTGDRGAPLGMSLAAALSGLAEERSSVSLCVVGGGDTTGEIVSVAEDFVTVRSRGSGAPPVHVPFAAIEACELR